VIVAVNVIVIVIPPVIVAAHVNVITNVGVIDQSLTIPRGR
jgi:hypothetical protein